MEERPPQRSTNPVKEIPWKTFAKHLAAIGVGTGAGYLAGGAVLSPMFTSRAPTRLAEKIRQLSPEQRKRLRLGIAGVTGMAIPVAQGASRLAMTSDMWHKMQDQWYPEEKLPEKTAAVLSAYGQALERLR